jgi:shikimate dehydrogenase
MKNTFRINTQVIGLIGHPIKHSYSPFIHNVTIELKKLDYIYLPFDVPASNLKNALKGMVALGIKGFNVTIPHKESIIQYVDNVSEEASMIGAVNTVVIDDGKLNGYNTDVHGVYESLLPFKDDILGKQVTIIGAGGAARAVIYTLIRHFKPENITIINRTEQRAETLKRNFSEKMKYPDCKTSELFPKDNVEILRNSKLIINATPVGMYPNIDDSFTTMEDSFTSNQIVFDLVYNPMKTKLLKIAASKGAVTIDGVKMLVFQAAKAFELWTGEELPVEELHKSLQLVLSD